MNAEAKMFYEEGSVYLYIYSLTLGPIQSFRRAEPAWEKGAHSALLNSRYTDSTPGRMRFYDRERERETSEVSHIVPRE
jgi:hypothetical protein